MRFVRWGVAIAVGVAVFLLLSAGGPPETFDVRVVFVIDGDTIEIEGGERVRYIGIDTPEISGPQLGPECYATEATERNRELVEGKTVRLVADTSDRDAYGRLLRYVYVDGTFVNLELIESGHARAVRIEPDTEHYNRLRAAQERAIRDKAGLWSACR